MRDSVLIGPGGGQARPKPLLRTTLGQILRRARREQGRTLADVARAARVSMPYLSELERGRKEASSEVLAAVCDALRIELSDLLAEAGRHFAAERARRALIEERARRKERAGELPADITERPAGIPANTANTAGRSGRLAWPTRPAWPARRAWPAPPIARRGFRRSRRRTSRWWSRWMPSAAAVSRRPEAPRAAPRPSPPDQRLAAYQGSALMH